MTEADLHWVMHLEHNESRSALYIPTEIMPFQTLAQALLPKANEAGAKRIQTAQFIQDQLKKSFI